MQHVLRCWERQSDGSEYKKTLRRPGLRSDPAGELTALPQTPYQVGRGWLSLPKNPISRSRPFGPRFSYPHSKISSDAVAKMSSELCDGKQQECWIKVTLYRIGIGTSGIWESQTISDGIVNSPVGSCSPV